MSEPRKNHLTIDGGQVKEDEHVASYKPIPDAEAEFRSSKSNLSKSKEKVSADGAEEKLLPKEEEAKIVTRVDMADAKYVVGDHRNGDAKIELDANKRQFSGLTKEELLKYADDPFWVRLRWFLFVLFWAMWLCMLAGAIVIIVRAPKCAPPTPKTWFEVGPLVEMEDMSVEEVEVALPVLQSARAQGVFMDAPAYQVLDQPALLDNFKALFTNAKEYGVKVIVDLIPNYVSIEHAWFKLSENRTGDYAEYFVWRKSTEYDTENKLLPPVNWRSTLNASAWTYSEVRKEYYLHQYAENQPDLNFRNPSVVAEFDGVLKTWIQAGAAGVRLNKARLLLVDSSFEAELAASGRGSSPGADQTQYAFWRHARTSDQPGLDDLFSHWSQLVKTTAEAAGLYDSVFTLEETSQPELFLLKHNVSALRPRSTAPIPVGEDVTTLVDTIKNRLGHWPIMQLKPPAGAEEEVGAFALLLPAAPVFSRHQVDTDNDTSNREVLSHLVKLREDASIQHGDYRVAAVPARSDSSGQLIACARWKEDHAGYVAVYNPTAQELRANLTGLESVPDALTLHHTSHAVKLYHNYTKNLDADDVLVPPKSTVVLNYLPRTTAEN